MKISQMSKKFTKNSQKIMKREDNNDVQFCNTTNLDNELQNNLEENENNEKMDSHLQ